MNSYKRHIYKTKNPPKPQPPVIQASWFASDSQAPQPNTDYCKPIENQVFKDPNSPPIVLGDKFTDNSGGVLYGGSSKNNTYTISNFAQSSFALDGQTGIPAITTNPSGEVIDINYGDCNDNTDTPTLRPATRSTPTVIQGNACGLEPAANVNVVVDNGNLTTVYTDDSNPILYDGGNEYFRIIFGTQDVSCKIDTNGNATNVTSCI